MPHRLAALALAALLPILAPAQDVPTDLTYVTFNIGGGAISNFDLPRAAQIIKALDADFVALQEVDQWVGRNGNPARDTAGDIAEAAGYPHHVFAKAIDLRGGEYGVALLSKHEPLSVSRHLLPSSNEQRVLLDARFRMADGKTLAILVTHLDFPSSARQKQTLDILRYLDENPADRVLLAGDLNAELGSPELDILASALTPLTPDPDSATYIGDQEDAKAIDHFFGRTALGEAWRMFPDSRHEDYDDATPVSDHVPVLLHVAVASLGPPAPVPNELSCLNFNAAGGVSSSLGYSSPFDVEAVGALLKELDADFVALQKVDHWVERAGNPARDTAGDIAESAGYPHHFFAKAIDLRDGAYGVALLSKHRPLSVNAILLPNPENTERRVLLDARFRMANGKTLAVLVTHFETNETARRAQAQALLDHLSATPADRVLLSGFLNDTIGSPTLATLTTQLTLLTPDPDQSTTLDPDDHACDHILAGTLPDEQWLSLPGTRRVYYEGAPLSDHLPLLVRLRLRLPGYRLRLR